MALDSCFPDLTSRAESAVPPKLKLHYSMGRDSVAQDEDVANTGLVTEAECGSSSFFFLPCVQMMLNLGKAVEAGTGYATQQFFSSFVRDVCLQQHLRRPLVVS